MKNLQNNLKNIFIVTLIVLLAFSIGSFVTASSTVYTETTYAQKGDVVYFQKPDSWSNAYIYAWDNYKNPQNKLGGSFPGVTMTLVEGNLYKYTFESDVSYAQLIFSDGTGSNQTADLDYICNGYIYTADSTDEKLAYSSTSLKIGDTIYFEKIDSWSDDIYIYLWKDGGSQYCSWKSVKMTNVSGNLYSYTLNSSDAQNSGDFDMVIFADSSNQTKNLSTVGTDVIFKADADKEGKDGIWVYTSNQLSELSNLITKDTVPSSDVSYYTEDSYSIYKTQYDLAKEVVNSSYVAVTYYDLTSQYNKSLLALPFAYNNLKLNTSILSDKITEMEAVDTSKYDPNLVSAFNQSIKDAKNTLADSSSLTITSMKTAISNMKTAYDNLVIDKTELENLIKKASELDSTLYTDDSFAVLSNSLSEATVVNEDANASYSDVQAQIQNLNNAISQLVLKEEASNEIPNEVVANEDSNTTDNQNNTTDDTASTPTTGDNILKVVGALIIAVITFAGIKVYLKKKQ